MKIIFCFVLICSLVCGRQFAQALSSVTYDAGTTIDVGTGADICAGNIFINGTYSGAGTICSGPLPVTLSSFTSSVINNSARLIWVTEAELNNSGFDIERAYVTQSGSEGWEKVGFVQGSGTTTQPKGYLYEDKKLPTGNYRYRLKQIDFNGNYEYFELPNDVVIAPPNKFSVSQNYPNPGNPKSKIDYEMPVNGKVTIIVYDILGKEIFTLVNEQKDAGYYTAEFDGSSIASAVYFYRFLAEGEGQKFSKTMKMLLVK